MSIISNGSSLNESASLGLEVFSRTLLHPNSKYFIQSDTPISQKHKPNDIINAIHRDKDTDHLKVNSDFQQYLFVSDDNPENNNSKHGMGLVSFVGEKSTGKAFLADSVISEDIGRVARGFSKTSKSVINSSCYDFEDYDGNPIQLFVQRKDASKDSFFWMYLISSVMVLNIRESESSEFKSFTKSLKSVQKNLAQVDGQLSKPKLIIALKNSDGSILNQEKFNQFLDDVQQTQLFDRSIITLSFPYPGEPGVKEKEILDVPLVSLSSQYIDSVKKLNHILKSSRPKNIMGNTITPKFLSYIIGAVTNEINNKGSDKIRVSKIWDGIVEQYGIGYHNFYLTDFSQRLGKELEDEKPRSTLELYQLIMEIKRGTDRKAAGFQNLDDDPIFQKYKKQVILDISEKEKKVVQINQGYSEKRNQAIAEDTFAPINSLNYQRRIDDYNKHSQYEHSKADTLANTFDRILKGENSSVKVGAVRDQNQLSSRWRGESLTDSMAGVISGKETELKSIEERLKTSRRLGSQNVDDKMRQIGILRLDNQAKQEQIKQAQQELKRLKLSTGTLRNKQIEDLEREVNGLSSTVNQKILQNQKLRKQKENLIKSKVQELNGQLGKEQIIYSKSSMMRAGSCVKKAEVGAKDGRCYIM